jgi:hypothetical protein
MAGAIMTDADNAATQCCEICGTADIELFGYRHCAVHKPGQLYADTRLLPSPEKGRRVNVSPAL